MLMSTDRILVSHVGSLPRPEALSDLLIRQEAGETIDADRTASQVEAATAHVIDKQARRRCRRRQRWRTIAGRISNIRSALPMRVRRRVQTSAGPWTRSNSPATAARPQCAFRIRRGYRMRPAALSEVRTSTARRSRRMPQGSAHGKRLQRMLHDGPSPGIVATTMLNQHYDSHEAYLMALARALSQRISGDP